LQSARFSTNCDPKDKDRTRESLNLKEKQPVEISISGGRGNILGGVILNFFLK
jgi:hypothetical protein